MTDEFDQHSFRGGLSFGAPARLKTAKTATYTIVPEVDGSLVLADASGAGFTITLPPANWNPNGMFIAIKLTTSSANTCTVAGAGTDTIDGAATSTLLVTTKKCLQLHSDGVSDWKIVGAF